MSMGQMSHPLSMASYAYCKSERVTSGLGSEDRLIMALHTWSLTSATLCNAMQYCAPVVLWLQVGLSAISPRLGSRGVKREEEKIARREND